MNFNCGVCGERADIVGFKDDGFVDGVIGVVKRIAMCRDCKAESLKIPIDDTTLSRREPGCDDDLDYPF